jgi:transcriptional regulator with XRE-family HTH domain
MRDKALIAFGAKVREKREAKNLSQEGLAELADLAEYDIVSVPWVTRKPMKGVFMFRHKYVRTIAIS